MRKAAYFGSNERMIDKIVHAVAHHKAVIAMNTVEENKQSALRFIDEILNKGNIDEVDSFVTPLTLYIILG
jgi:hypothetical protein